MFRQKHPYLFWQLIGWGILLADFGFLVIASLCEYGEWCYPVMVFTFIAGLFAVAASPVIVRLTRRRLIPQNTDERTERLFNSKIAALMTVRRGAGFGALSVVLAFSSILVFIFAAYILGERVHLALGFTSIVLAIVSPFLIIGIYSANTVRSFFKVKNGEKRVEFIQPDSLKELWITNPRTLVVAGEPNAVLLNFFYNWLRYYLRGERLSLYKISAPELCRDFRPKDILQYDDILLCIPEEQLDLTEEKEALFKRECDIMSAFPFSLFVYHKQEDISE